MIRHKGQAEAVKRTVETPLNDDFAAGYAAPVSIDDFDESLDVNDALEHHLHQISPSVMLSEMTLSQDSSQTAETGAMPGSVIGPIVSSSHLAEGGSTGMSELEYGLILASHAFSRWMIRCMAAAGLPGLSAIEVLILHSIRHRGREKKLADICLVLDIEDTHIATYAIRKLEKAGLLTTGKAAKEKTVKITDKGADACARYAQIRERLLIGPTAIARPSEATLSEVAALLRFMSGAFNQAARSAVTL